MSLAKLACRQQLEEMAEKFDFPSGRRFAAEILARTSAQRVTWLREYYASLNQPELSSTVADNFPQLQSAQTSSSDTTKVTGFHSRTPKTDPKTPLEATHEPEASSNYQSCVRQQQKRQKISRRNLLKPEGQEETLGGVRGHSCTKGGSVWAAAALGTAGGLGGKRASSSSSSSSGPGSAEAVATFLTGVKRDPLSSDVTDGRSTPASKPAGPGSEPAPKPSTETGGNTQGHGGNPSPAQQAAPSRSRQSFLTELIGDTSILDNLLKPNARSVQLTHPTEERRPAKPSPTEEFTASPEPNAPVAQKAPAKARCKDFWDILTEGNEESINRLTDPAEVQKACVNTKFAAGGRSAEGERKSLWKTNENFLWKKH